jgi:NAD dependent epimerase/dehydratase family enzyme
MAIDGLNEKKLEIRSSRINSTKNMVTAIQNSLERIKVFVTASAIGIYGDKGDDTLTESSKIGESFLAKLCQEWEQEGKEILLPKCPTQVWNCFIER